MVGTKQINGWQQMVKVRLKGILRIRARLADGSRMEYHSIRGEKQSRFWKSTDPFPIGSPEYLAAYQEVARPPADEEKFGSVIDAYFDSGEFRDLSPRTKKDYQRWGNEVRAKFASAPKSAIESPKIRQIAMKWRDQWDGRNADYAWTVLSLIVSWAYEAGKLQQHHLRRGKKRYKVDRAEIIWTEFEVQKIEATAPEWICRALRAAVETGLRPGDLVRFNRGHVTKTTAGRRVQIRTNKRGRPATIPVTQALADIIDSTPAGRMLILVNGHGEQLSEEWLSKALNRARKSAGLREELRLYDARGACVTRLVIAGATLSEIAHHMGWGLTTAAKMIETYAAMDPDLSDSVLVKLDQIRNKTAK